jgi:hypothetical protein
MLLNNIYYESEIGAKISLYNIEGSRYTLEVTSLLLLLLPSHVHKHWTILLYVLILQFMSVEANVHAYMIKIVVLYLLSSDLLPAVCSATLARSLHTT